eukprot:jgi/Bigna1/89572/estExt_fgenesh1_pg.C_510148
MLRLVNRSCSWAAKGGKARRYLSSSLSLSPSSSSSSLPTRNDHLVSNKFNKVQVHRCESAESISEALEGKAGKLPHLCVAGVSNAGKSSMINHLLVKKNIARASSVAGKTKTIDMFIVNDAFVITDFPGMPSTDPQVDGMWKGKWRPLIKDYMTQVTDIRSFIYIHDIRWPIATDEMIRSISCFHEEGNRAQMTLKNQVDHNRRLMGLNNARNKLGFEDKDRHLHYCSNNSLSSCRRSRRLVLRYIESVLGFPDSSDDVGVVLQWELSEIRDESQESRLAEWSCLQSSLTFGNQSCFVPTLSEGVNTASCEDTSSSRFFNSCSKTVFQLLHFLAHILVFVIRLIPRNQTSFIIVLPVVLRSQSTQLDRHDDRLWRLSSTHLQQTTRAVLIISSSLLSDDAWTTDAPTTAESTNFSRLSSYVSTAAGAILLHSSCSRHTYYRTFPYASISFFSSPSSKTWGLAAAAAAASSRPSWHQTMLRIRDPKESLAYYQENYGMRLLDKIDFPDAKFSLYFLATMKDNEPSPEPGTLAAHKYLWSFEGTTLELTHNWGTEDDPSPCYHPGNDPGDGFGHIAFACDDVYKTCHELEVENSVSFKKRPDEGRMKGLAFAYDPDKYWVEIVKNLEPLETNGYKALTLAQMVGEGETDKDPGKPVLELTHNHGTENDEGFWYKNGNDDGENKKGFGHIGFLVDDVYVKCKELEEAGYKMQKAPDGGRMKGLAFALDPDGYWVEIIKRGGYDDAGTPYFTV